MATGKEKNPQDLIDAAMDDDVHRIKSLIDGGYDVNKKGIYSIVGYESTALHVASAEGHLDVAQVLIKHGALVNAMDKHGLTPLHHAVYEGHVPVIRLLLESQAATDIEATDGKTALTIAGRSAHQNKGVAKFFLEYFYDDDKITNTIFNAIYNRDTRIELSNHHKMYCQQQEFNALMKEQPGVRRNIMKICLCGFGGNGKTTLKNALQRGFLEAKLLSRSKEKAPASGDEEYEPTPGIDMATINIAKVGTFRVWDFAGQTEYYVTHNMFLSAENSIFAIVFRITDKPEKQKKEVTSWLAFVKAVIMKCIEEDRVKPTVILIASRADLLKKGTRRQAEAMYCNISHTAREMFGAYLNILDETFILNCHDSQHSDMKRLRACIKLAKKEEIVPKICEYIRAEQKGWMHTNFPVMKWDSYLQKVKELKPFIYEEPVRKITRFLHYLGEILYIEGTLTQSGNIIVLDPQWLCTRVIGPMLAPEIFVQYSKRLEKKTMYTRNDVDVVFKDFADIDSLVDLLKELELLFEVSINTAEGTELRYVIPGLLENEIPEDQWKQDLTKKIYYGRRFQCRDDTDSFSPGLFPRLQTRLERHFRDLENPTKGIWKNGSKICCNVEGLVYMTKGWRAIHLCVRAEREEEIGECYKMLESVTDDVYDVINTCCPGTNIDVHVLSVNSLKNHSDPEKVSYYTMSQIIEAERKNAKVFDERENKLEETSSLLCIGYDPTVLRSLGYQSDVKWMLGDTLKTFSIIMDKRRSVGGDYRMMADLMGFEHAEVAGWEERAFPKSITQHILSEWSKRWADRKRGGEKLPENDCFYQSNFINLMKILRHEDCNVDIAREEIQKMFNKL
ncbi:death-associated protein kinase 1-like [Ptychodera flava]|uniref:death-associated protein kinase 1-like n=1 Tax=Ptychodera flava TaxID=63121 RepID=UPI00396AA485